MLNKARFLCEVMIHIREAKTGDFDLIWPIVREIVSSGDTYAYDRNISKEMAFKGWMETPCKTYVVEENSE
ncbi:MAG: hypothetical protein MI744_00935, partial [Pseudomonadales bacterium]|nr:hypothetical protein [Pseudomonadales bacterium]